MLSGSQIWGMRRDGMKGKEWTNSKKGCENGSDEGSLSKNSRLLVLYHIIFFLFVNDFLFDL